MSFFSNATLDSNRQMFCNLYDGYTLRKKTKSYRQKLRNTRMTMCGSSTGVLLPPVLHDFLKHVIPDGVIVRCLFIVLGYHEYLREQYAEQNLNMPTIAQLMLAVVLLGQHQYFFNQDAQIILDNYTNQFIKKAHNAQSLLMASFFAKQPSQVLRMCAITQIIDLLPFIIERVSMYMLSYFD